VRKIPHLKKNLLYWLDEMEGSSLWGARATATAANRTNYHCPTHPVASAIRILARAILLGHEHLSQICDTSQKAWETERGCL
jgi:hypothetical protein